MARFQNHPAVLVHERVSKGEIKNRKSNDLDFCILQKTKQNTEVPYTINNCSVLYHRGAEFMIILLTSFSEIDNQSCKLTSIEAKIKTI